MENINLCPRRPFLRLASVILAAAIVVPAMMLAGCTAHEEQDKKKSILPAKLPPRPAKNPE